MSAHKSDLCVTEAKLIINCVPTPLIEQFTEASRQLLPATRVSCIFVGYCVLTELKCQVRRIWVQTAYAYCQDMKKRARKTTCEVSTPWPAPFLQVGAAESQRGPAAQLGLLLATWEDSRGPGGISGRWPSCPCNPEKPTSQCVWGVGGRGRLSSAGSKAEASSR